MSTVDRRQFLRISGLAAGGAAGGVLGTAAPARASTAVNLDYPRTKVGNIASMAINEPIAFNYPDDASPCVAIRMGRATTGGAGPDADLVAYSTLCTHMGCPVSYDPDTRNFKCPCHFSVFDGELAGQMVAGQATENLPPIVLEIDEASGDVFAVSVEGLIYGRQANML